MLAGLLVFALLPTAVGGFLLQHHHQQPRRAGLRMTSTVAPAVDAYVQSKLHPSGVMEVTLSRPRQLNALSSQMLRDLLVILKDAGQRQDVRAILLSAVEGRAFCAGGDIKEILTAVKHRRQSPGSTPEGCDATAYITIEYELDALVHHLASVKPVVAVGDGIIMGGGAGIFQGAGIRVVTPRCLFAMPECRIALLPDAGAMYFLHRAPGHLPMYLALTGARLTGHEMQETGLATHMVPEESVAELLGALRSVPDVDVLAEVTAREVHPSNPPTSPVMRRLSLIDRVFGKRSVREVYQALKDEKAELPGSSQDLDWIDVALQALESECPVSHVCTHHAISVGSAAGPAWNIDRGLGIEYVANCVLGFRDDFIEGVDCTVGDKKGQRPAWTHSSWEEAEEDEAVQSLLVAMDGVTPVMDLIAAKARERSV